MPCQPRSGREQFGIRGLDVDPPALWSPSDLDPRRPAPAQASVHRSQRRGLRLPRDAPGGASRSRPRSTQVATRRGCGALGASDDQCGAVLTQGAQGDRGPAAVGSRWIADCLNQAVALVVRVVAGGSAVVRLARQGVRAADHHRGRSALRRSGPSLREGRRRRGEPVLRTAPGCGLDCRPGPNITPQPARTGPRASSAQRDRVAERHHAPGDIRPVQAGAEAQVLTVADICMRAEALMTRRNYHRKPTISTKIIGFI
jgi:hypothetical protein